MYWVLKFYTIISPSFTIEKNIVDRFISEDPVNCPVLKYYVTEVYEKGITPIPSSQWSSVFSLDENTGDFVVSDFSNIIDDWQIHLKANNEFKSSESSPYYIISLTVWKPYIPPNLAPSFVTGSLL